jgi:hypothetical protein
MRVLANVLLEGVLLGLAVPVLLEDGNRTRCDGTANSIAQGATPAVGGLADDVTDSPHAGACGSTKGSVASYLTCRGSLTLEGIQALQGCGGLVITDLP